MKTLVDIEKRITAIEKRNNRVELDKAWETSWTRRIVLIVLTYVLIGCYLQTIHVSNPWMNAIVPSLGFFVSTLTLSFIKGKWIEHNRANK